MVAGCDLLAMGHTRLQLVGCAGTGHKQVPGLGAHCQLVQAAAAGMDWHASQLTLGRLSRPSGRLMGHHVCGYPSAHCLTCKGVCAVAGRLYTGVHMQQYCM